MASYRMGRNGKAQILFRVGDDQFSRTVPVEDERDARRICGVIDDTLKDIERGRLVMPEGVDRRAFVFSGGKVAKSVEEMAADDKADSLRRATLGSVFQLHLDHSMKGSKQSSSLATERIHRNHFLRVFGPDKPISEIDLPTVERYVRVRAGRSISRDTIVKELATLLVIWKWAHKRKHVAGLPDWDMGSVDLPKGSQKPEFRTWAQIERDIRENVLSGQKAEEAWESLYLDQRQTVEIVEWVTETAKHPFLPAMFAFAAFTGARRSEMVRSERKDWDFDGNTVVIREKKSDRSREYTTRSMTIHSKLRKAMMDWLDVAPESKWAIVNAHGRPMRPMVATWHFRKTVEGSKWEVLRGWHVFRHSLASNMASTGVDQRIINATLGHHTEEMARRYGHLLPDKKESALLRMYE